VGLPPGAELADVAPPGSPDLITTYFHEIHGLRQSVDSSCGTPPTLNLEAIHRDFDANLPLVRRQLFSMYTWDPHAGAWQRDRARDLELGATA